MFQLPRESRVLCAIQPSNQWGWQEILLNKATYFLEVIGWQKTKDAQKKQPAHAPKMFVPEFMKSATPERALSRGSVVHDVDDIKAILARSRK